MHNTETNINNTAYSYYFYYFIKATKLEVKHFFINEKNYKDLVIYFTRYDRGKIIRILRLYYHELL